MPIASVAVMESSVINRDKLRESRNLGSTTAKNPQMPSKARAIEKSRMEEVRIMKKASRKRMFLSGYSTLSKTNRPQGCGRRH
ncbi:MAG: hypothetical protein V4599_15235 [Verrucomicrobiota bacterium]